MEPLPRRHCAAVIVSWFARERLRLFYTFWFGRSYFRPHYPGKIHALEVMRWYVRLLSSDGCRRTKLRMWPNYWLLCIFISPPVIFSPRLLLSSPQVSRFPSSRSKVDLFFGLLGEIHRSLPWFFIESELNWCLGELFGLKFPWWMVTLCVCTPVLT